MMNIFNDIKAVIVYMACVIFAGTSLAQINNGGGGPSAAVNAGTGLSAVGNTLSVVYGNVANTSRQGNDNTFTGLTVTGAIGAVSLNLSGALSVGGNSTFTGTVATNGLSGTTANFSGAGAFNGVSSTTGTFSGAVSVGSLTSLGAISGTTGSFSGISSTTGNFSSTLTASGQINANAGISASALTVLGNSTLTTVAMTDALNYAATYSLASAATTNIASATSNNITITGNTTITSFGSANSGIIRYVEFTGTPLLTYNATSLIIPGNANIQARPGDTMEIRSLGLGNWEVLSYTVGKSGSLLHGPSFKASLSITQSVTPGVATTVNATISDPGTYDTGGNFSGNTFIAPISGYYQFGSSVGFTGTSSVNCYANISLSGQPAIYGSRSTATSTYTLSVASGIVKLNNGDTATLQYFCLSATGINLDPSTTSFSGALIRNE